MDDVRKRELEAMREWARVGLALYTGPIKGDPEDWVHVPLYSLAALREEV